MSNALLEDAPPAAALPAWFRQRQQSAQQRYESLPLPTRRDEPWRFSNLQALSVDDFAPARPVSAGAARELLERSQTLGLPGAGGSMVFANDTLLHSSAAEASAKGVLWLPLAQALHSHAELIQSHWMRENGTLGSRKFSALHEASLRNGTLLFVPRGVKLEAPLQAFHWLAGAGQSIFPHTLLIAEEDSAVTFVDWFRSADAARHFSCGINDLWVGKGAEVRYVSVQEWSAETVALQANTTVVEAGGSALNLGVHLGGSYARSESLSRLVGPGARSEMLAVTLADAEREFDQRTLQDHRAPDTTSDLLYKNALYDRAKTIFAGLIRVGQEAHRTDAYQKVRNLLLSNEAEANSMPGLEILADQVRCSHGATTGEINEEELFYMLARGIRKEDAQRLMTFGFLNEVLERLPEKALRERLQERLQSRLKGH